MFWCGENISCRPPPIFLNGRPHEKASLKIILQPKSPYVDCWLLHWKIEGWNTHLCNARYQQKRRLSLWYWNAISGTSILVRRQCACCWTAVAWQPVLSAKLLIRPGNCHLRLQFILQQGINISLLAPSPAASSQHPLSSPAPPPATLQTHSPCIHTIIFKMSIRLPALRSWLSFNKAKNTKDREHAM